MVREGKFRFQHDGDDVSGIEYKDVIDTTGFKPVLSLFRPKEAWNF
jgi:hypothetical protein